MQKRTEETTITVPVPQHKEIRVGTLMSIIRKSQLP
jgi:predicted RNA binding protein YcfA (HicA-like mRNA interferase family)